MKVSNHKKNQRLKFYLYIPFRQCPNCKVWHNKSGHFAPPSHGEPGFFICPNK